MSLEITQAMAQAIAEFNQIEYTNNEELLDEAQAIALLEGKSI